jgi:hypothetical protein
MTTQLQKGQAVDYNMIWAGCARGYGEPLRDWFKGYVVIEPVSPYAKDCALIKRIVEGPIDGPFNAPYKDIRPA